ncbi:MAG: hypothetical protein ACPGO3_10655 [Magnetospiraceae bacterium]
MGVLLGATAPASAQQNVDQPVPLLGAPDVAPPAANPQSPAQLPGVEPPPGPAATLRDYKEDMRRLVQDIAGFARAYDRNFVVIAKGGRDLLTKVDDLDPDTMPLAATYIKSLDGILLDGVFYGTPEVGTPVAEKDRRADMDILARMKTAGLIPLVLDYATEPEAILRAYTQAAEAGYVSFVAPAKGLALNRLPTVPTPIQGENPNSITRLKDIRNYAMVRDSAPYGSREEFVLEMANTNYDLLIVDVFHRRKVYLNRQQVAGLKIKKLGARRLVLAYLDVGSAASYRYYWKNDWAPGFPAWIDSAMPGEPDRYFVQYWDPEWQSLLFGNEQSFIYGAILDLGFDGVVLDGLDTYRFFEGTLE